MDQLVEKFMLSIKPTNPDEYPERKCIICGTNPSVDDTTKEENKTFEYLVRLRGQEVFNDFYDELGNEQARVALCMFKTKLCDYCKATLNDIDRFSNSITGSLYKWRQLHFEKQFEQPKLEFEPRSIYKLAETWCNICKNDFGLVTKFEEHVKQRHFKESFGVTIVQCLSCNKCVEPSEINTHFRLHRLFLAPVKCPKKDCKKVFHNVFDAMEHEKDELQQRCVRCDVWTTNINRHTRDMHFNMDLKCMEFECNEPGCGEICIKAYELVAHVQVHAPHRCSCPVCGKTFHTFFERKQHHCPFLPLQPWKYKHSDYTNFVLQANIQPVRITSDKRRLNGKRNLLQLQRMQSFKAKSYSDVIRNRVFKRPQGFNKENIRKDSDSN